MVIDFTAKWCGPCKLMDPIVQEFAAKYTDVEFVKIDVDELMVCHTFPFTIAHLFLFVIVTHYTFLLPYHKILFPALVN